MSVFASRWRLEVPIDLTPVSVDDLYDADAWLAASPLADCAPDSTRACGVEDSGTQVCGGNCQWASTCFGQTCEGDTRRPCGKCPQCKLGENDMCSSGQYTERGIMRRHGFMAQYYVESPQWLNKIPKAVADIGILLEPMSVVEKGIDHAYRLQKRLPRDGAGLNGLHLGRAVDESRADFQRGTSSSGTSSASTARWAPWLRRRGRRRHHRPVPDPRRGLRRRGPPRLITDVSPGAWSSRATGAVRFFGEPDHDAPIIARPSVTAVAGMFCAGELGPVGGHNFLHGYTASVALFSE